jgi:hypothetical protein
MTRLKMVRLAQPAAEGAATDAARGTIYVTRAAADLRAQAEIIAKKGDEYGG